jgi:hypothetical protein
MASQSRVDETLSKFPGPLVLYPSRKKLILMLLGSTVFVAGGIWMVTSGAGMGWLVTVFFGLCMIVFVVMLLPGAGSLALDRDGFEITSLYRRHRSRWQDVAGFEVTSLPVVTPGRKMVVYNDGEMVGKSVARLNVALVGRNAGAARQLRAHRRRLGRVDEPLACPRHLPVASVATRAGARTSDHTAYAAAL